MNQSGMHSLEEQRPFLTTSDESSEEGLRHDSILTEKLSTHQLSHWFTIISIVLSLALIIAGVFQRPTESQCIKSMNGWSPMLEAVEYHQSDKEHASRAMYMGEPTAAIEERWETLWKGGSVGIPEHQLPLLNKSINEKDWHHLPAKQGGGIQAFFEGFHDLHCLNLVRQYTYRNKWNYTNHFFTNPHVPVLSHVEHCLEMLRAKIMCDADTTPFLIVGEPGEQKVDIGTVRSCHNVSKIKEWIERNMIIKDS